MGVYKVTIEQIMFVDADDAEEAREKAENENFTVEGHDIKRVEKSSIRAALAYFSGFQDEGGTP